MKKVKHIRHSNLPKIVQKAVHAYFRWAELRSNSFVEPIVPSRTIGRDLATESGVKWPIKELTQLYRRVQQDDKPPLLTESVFQQLVYGIEQK